MVLRLTDTASGLWIEVRVKPLPTFDAVDWVCEIGNDGERDSPLLEQFMPLNGRLLDTSPETAVTLRWSNGDMNIREAFMPQDEAMPVGTSRLFAPIGGRSSNGTLPFFTIFNDHAGCVLAIGWTGQWLVELERDADGWVRAHAGMESTRFRLRPGERVRTPRMLVLHWKGASADVGHNRFRQLMLAHYAPRCESRPARPPIAFNTAAAVYVTGNPTNSGNQERMAAQAAARGVEAFWLDAYWFPQPWYDHVGDWFPRPDDFPGGLAPLSRSVHELNMDFVLWFEPERVMPETRWGRELESMQISVNSSPARLLNLGLSNARRTVVDFLDNRIKELDIDVYRQDFNIDPLEYWRANDENDRQGITEMKYVEGLYAVWDELVVRNPGLRIDNCASGGRRIDIETLRRAWPLWRSDFNDIGEGLKGPDYFPMMGCADQIHVAGLSLYLPYHTGPVWSSRPYSWRSAMGAGIALYGRIEDFDSHMTRQAVAELHRLRPYFEGDFHLLTPLTTAQDSWHAYQLHLPSLDRGCVMLFRRPECPDPTVQLQLRGIVADHEYRVTRTGETYESSPPEAMSGAELQSISTTIDQRPGSMVLEYECVPMRMEATASG